MGAIIALCVLLCAPAYAETTGYRIIVNSKNPAASVDRQFLADVFLKKVTRWPNGVVAHPADLAAEAPARQHFSQDILKRAVEAVKNYWQQAIFSGRDVPPPEMACDEDVVKYVEKYPGGIGYISASGDASNVKVLPIH